MHTVHWRKKLILTILRQIQLDKSCRSGPPTVSRGGYFTKHLRPPIQKAYSFASLTLFRLIDVYWI